MSKWMTKTIAEIGQLVTGKTPPTGESGNYGGSVPFVTPTDMKGSRFIETTQRNLTQQGVNTVRSSLLPAHAILVSCIGTVGKTVLIKEVSVTNQQINSIIPSSDVDRMFIYYNLLMRRDEIKNLAGGAVQPILNKTDFGKLLIHVPPLTEQRRISLVLSSLDDKIDFNRRMNKTLEAMVRALFQEWFMDFGPIRAKAEGREPEGLSAEIAALFPDAFGSDGLPESWHRKSVYEITRVIYGAPFASNQFNNIGSGRPLIRIRDLVHESPGVWTPEAHPNGYMVQPGDIVVGMDGEFRAYLWGGSEAWLNQRVCVFAPKRGYSSAFVRNSIIDPLAHVEATEVATTVIHLGKNDIDRFKCTVPTMPILEAFNRTCNPFYNRIVENKKETRNLESMRDIILPKLMSGEIRVKDAERLVEQAA